MKNLLVMRHAKSDYPPGIADDFDRPLAKRGRKDVPRMAELLRAFGPRPECILSSSARRARETAEGMARGLGLPEEKVLFDERLYLADTETLYRVVSELSEACETVLVIAHNPGLEQWIGRLCGAEVRLPTAGLAAFALQLRRWSVLPEVQAQLQWFVPPRLIRAVTR